MMTLLLIRSPLFQLKYYRGFEVNKWIIATVTMGDLPMDKAIHLPQNRSTQIT
jgi:hypothetical protein